MVDVASITVAVISLVTALGVAVAGKFSGMLSAMRDLPTFSQYVPPIFVGGMSTGTLLLH
jgi:hypothetical protein